MSRDRVNVLLIEDDSDDVHWIKKIIEEIREPMFSFQWACSLKQGLEYLQKKDTGVVLLDLDLSESKGVETLTYLDKWMARVPIIVLVNSTDEEMGKQAMQLGAHDFLVKSQINQVLLAKVLRYSIERKKIEEELEYNIAELQATQKKIISQERLRALGKMASGIVHDFNNALAPIVGFTELLLNFPEKLNDREKTLHFLKSIHIAAQDATHIVKRLSEFYRDRKKDEVLHPVYLDKVIHQTILLTQPRWKDQMLAQGVYIEVQVKIEAEDVPPLYGDEYELRELLTNFIFNSIDAMPRGGILTISLQKQEKYLLLKVQDTGIGMSEEIVEHCLEPFFSTKEEHGTGLGLSMCYGIIQRYNGSIEIKSQEGEGTTFIIRFPFTKVPKYKQNMPYVISKEISLKILVVDDQVRIIKMLAEYLRTDAHIVETAKDGLEGLQKFKNGNFEVVITDRAMPKMNGDQMAQAIKKLNPDIPIIMLSGFSTMMKFTGEKPPGVDFILEKPVTIEKLRTALARLVLAEKLSR